MQQYIKQSDILFKEGLNKHKTYIYPSTKNDLELICLKKV